jgi:DNA-directed RNA polymerase subunit omega
MNAELVKKALEKVINPNVLVNMVSRRVRQLNAGGGGTGRPMVANTTNQGLADIALREIIEDKMGFEMPEIIELTRPTSVGRKKPAGWAKQHPAANGSSAKQRGKTNDDAAGLSRS